MFFDTHAHYDDKAFDPDREELLRSMPDLSVGLIIDPGSELESSRRAIELSERYPHVYAAVGIHPEELSDYTEEGLKELRRLAGHEKCVAIGEIGLDYYWDDSQKEKQKELFRRQIELALELKLPIIVHDREAHGDSLDIIRSYPKLCGVFHCFSGSVEMAEELIRRGWYLGFDGPLTYKNARKSREVLSACPMERILLETDSPYLPPVPMRGKRNDSTNLRYIAQTAAEIKGISVDEIVRISTENGKRLFGIE